MPLRQRLQELQSVWLDIAAILADAMQKTGSSREERTCSPA